MTSRSSAPIPHQNGDLEFDSHEHAREWFAAQGYRLAQGKWNGLDVVQPRRSDPADGYESVGYYQVVVQ